MASFADVAFLLSMIVFVFVLFPALVADWRWRRRNALLTLNVEIDPRRSVHWLDDRDA